MKRRYGDGGAEMLLWHGCILLESKLWCFCPFADRIGRPRVVYISVLATQSPSNILEEEVGR